MISYNSFAEKLLRRHLESDFESVAESEHTSVSLYFVLLNSSEQVYIFRNSNFI